MEAQATVIHRRRSGMRSVGNALGALAGSAADVVEEVMRAAASVAPETRRRRKGCGCGEPCGHEHCNCHCTCCVCDADLVVYTRVGERRVVPVRIENERSRERQVKLSVSDFTTRGGSAAPVKVSLLGGTDLTIAPCATEDATLLVAPSASSEDIEKPQKGREGKLPDVDDCVVAVGDLRVDGCDIRPVRIAVAVVPRDCSPFEIGCGCSCC